MNPNPFSHPRCGRWAFIFVTGLFSVGTNVFAFDEAAFIAGTDSSEDAVESYDADSEKQDSAPVADSAVSSSALQFHGRFEDQFTLMVQKNGNDRSGKHLYNYLQLRLDMDAELPHHMTLRSDGVVRLTAGDTAISISEIIPPGTLRNALAQDARLSSLMRQEYTIDNRAYLDNAYVKIPVGAFWLTLGKQPLGQGAGYVWNPTDVFTQKEMLDPTYQQEGIIAARLTAPMGRASLELVTAPDSKFHHWKSGGRFQFPLGPFQFSTVGYYTRASYLDVEHSMDAVEAAALEGRSADNALIVQQHKRITAGGDMVVDVHGVRLWAEGAYNYLPHGTDWVEAEGGLEYYFSFETHLMLEYFYYGRSSVSHGGSYDLNSWMNVLEGNLKMLGRQFLFQSLEHPIADFWSLGVSSFQSLSDGSAIFEADLRWDFAQDAQLWLMAAKGFGDREDFLTNSFQSWLRMTLFF